MPRTRHARNAGASESESAQEESFHDRKDWALPITFEIPEHPKPAEVLLAKDIVRLDHRSIWTLGSGPERGEVFRLLSNVIVFLGERQPEVARGLLDHAEAVYYQHIQARNRLRYLSGMLAGIGVIVVFGSGLKLLLANTTEAVLSIALLPMILLFAGMGSITSVLTRLSSIDLRDQTSKWMIFISGMARPVTGLFFALAVYLVISLRIVDLHIGPGANAAGSGADPTPPALFLIAAFMSGFSERFAQDILTKLGGVVSASEPRKARPKGAPLPAPEDSKEGASET